MPRKTEYCPLSQSQIVDEYFAESRNKLLELAAFFDRLDRAQDAGSASTELRVEALRRAARLMLEPGPGRVSRILMELSDPTPEPLETLDRKGALGAYTGANEQR